MANTHMGKWRDPPLAYVVAEVVISPHYQLAQFVPAIQQALRASFPRTIESADVSFGLAMAGEMSTPMPTPERIWRLLTADLFKGVHLATRALSLHATSYDDFPDFLEHLELVLKTIHESKLNPFVERIGLRYIDYVLPSQDHQPADYVASGLRGISPPSAGPAQVAMWMGTFSFGDCVVNSRIAAPAPPEAILPPNFAPLPLAKPATMVAAELRMQEHKPFGFIDTDCTRVINGMFDPTDLLVAFDRMHEFASNTFKATMSDLACEEWV